MDTKHSIPNSAQSAGKEIAQAFIRAKMHRNFEEMAVKELSDLHGHMMSDGKHIEAAAVASAIRTLESRSAQLNHKASNDSAQALYTLSNSALCAANQHIKKVIHDTDESVLYIHLNSGLKMAISCTRFDVELFDVRWGPERRTQNSNFAFNVDEAAVLSIISR